MVSVPCVERVIKMLKPVSTKPDPQIMAKVQAPATERIWCDECQTDQYILIEEARKRRHHGESTWDVDYTCTNCDSFCGHEIQTETLTTPMAFAIIELVQRKGY